MDNAGDDEHWTITEADKRKRTRGAARIARFKTRQSLARRFVSVAEVIDHCAKSQTNPIKRNELRREAWLAFVRYVEVGFFEHDGTRTTKPQLRIWSEGGMPRRVDMTSFRDIIETFYEDSVDDYTGCIWLPIAAVLRWCGDRGMEPKEAWALAGGSARKPPAQSVATQQPEAEIAPPVVGTPAKRGRPDKYDWGSIEEFVRFTMNDRGDFDEADSSWNHVGKLYPIVKDFCSLKFGASPVNSHIEPRIRNFVEKWKSSPTTKNQ